MYTYIIQLLCTEIIMQLFSFLELHASVTNEQKYFITIIIVGILVNIYIRNVECMYNYINSLLRTTVHVHKGTNINKSGGT